MRQVPAFLCLVLLTGACGLERAVVSPPLSPAARDPEPDPVRVLRAHGPSPCDGAAALEISRVLEALQNAGRGSIVEVEPEGDPVWPSPQDDRFDVGVLYGVEAARALSEDSALAWTRLPEWDRVLGLWLDPDSRWLADPALRAWIAAVVDRERLVRVVFSGHALATPGRNDGPPNRPLGSATRPRLPLRYAPGDPYARAMAAAIKADLQSRGFDIEIGSHAGAAPMRIVVLQREGADSVDDARRWLACLGDGAADARAVLETAERAADADSREAVASRAIDVLTEDSRWVPLLRVPAWLGVREDGP
jgi:hypothetical protein